MRKRGEREFALQADLSVLIEEYKAGRQEIMARLGWQQQILGFGTAGLAGHLAAAAALVGKPGESSLLQLSPWLLTSASILSCSIGLLLSREDYMIIQLAFYQNSVLAPAINGITKTQRLKWDTFRSKDGMGEDAFSEIEPLRLRLSKVPHGYFQSVAAACAASAIILATFNLYIYLASQSFIWFRIDRSTATVSLAIFPTIFALVLGLISCNLFYRYVELRQRTKNLYPKLWANRIGSS